MRHPRVGPPAWRSGALLLLALAVVAACSGAAGATGPAGPQGATGNTGATGNLGIQGSAGAPGSPGSQGTPGAPGTNAPTAPVNLDLRGTWVQLDSSNYRSGISPVITVVQVTRSSLRLSWLRNQTYVATGTSSGYMRIFTNGVPDAPPSTSTEIGGYTTLLTVQGDSLYGVTPLITPVGSGTPSLLTRTVTRTGAACRGANSPDGDCVWVNLVRMTKTGN